MYREKWKADEKRNKQHGRRGSNSRHPVLETGALPTELLPYCGRKGNGLFRICKPFGYKNDNSSNIFL